MSECFCEMTYERELTSKCLNLGIYPEQYHGWYLHPSVIYDCSSKALTQVPGQHQITGSRICNPRPLHPSFAQTPALCIPIIFFAMELP